MYNDPEKKEYLPRPGVVQQRYEELKIAENKAETVLGGIAEPVASMQPELKVVPLALSPEPAPTPNAPVYSLPTTGDLDINTIRQTVEQEAA
jgi:hypothetical protein